MNNILEQINSAPFLNNGLLLEEFWGNSVKQYLLALVAFITLYLVFLVFKKIGLRQLKKIADKSENKVDDTIHEALDTIKPLFLIYVALFASLQILNVADIIDQTAYTILVIFGVWQAIFVVQVAVSYILNKTLRNEKGEYTNIAGGLINTLVKISLWILGLLFILSNLGVNVVSLVAGLGIGGVAIALALQNILEDLFSSFAIFFDKPFAVGDFIVVGENMGTVKKIGIKTTRLRSLQGEEIVITNKELTGARIQNFKRMKERRIVFKFGVIYSTGNDKLQAIPALVRDIIDDVKMARYDRAHFQSFDDSALTFEVVYHVESGDYNDYMDTNQNILFKIKEVFEKKGVEMAYPTQTIYLAKE